MAGFGSTSSTAVGNVTLSRRTQVLVICSPTPRRRKGFNILCTRMTQYLWPKGTTDNDIMSLDMGALKSDRNCPPSSLGYGAADVLNKTRNTAHKLMLEFGSKELFLQLCREIYGYTSDQGVDYKVIDACGGLDGFTEVQDWLRQFAEIAVGRRSLVAGSTFLFFSTGGWHARPLPHVVWRVGEECGEHCIMACILQGAA